MLTDTVQIATMTQRGLCAVFLITAHTLHLRVVTCSLSKTVGHQHIQHIGIGESHPLLTAHLPRLQLVLHFGLIKLQCHRTWLSVLYINIYKKVVGRVKAHQTINRDTGIIGGHTLHITDAIAIDHQLHRRVLQSHIPVGRIYPVNHCLFSCHHCHVQCHKGR